MSDTNEDNIFATKVESSQNDLSNFESGSSSMYEVAEYLRKQKSLSESEVKSLLDWFDQKIEKVGKKINTRHVYLSIAFLLESTFFKGSKPSKLRNWKD